MRGRRLKLTPVIDVYSLQGMGAELERRWTAEGDERSSLRDLAEYFNTEMLTTVLSRDGEPPPHGEVADEHERATPAEEAESVRQLRGRISTVTETKREQLRSREEIPLASSARS